MQDDKNYFVYLMTNQNKNVLYVGVTNNLERRVFEHKNKIIKGFTYKYNIDKLVYFEQTGNIEAAILREKQIKGWSRAKKDTLINATNLNWLDISEEWCSMTGDSSLHSE